MIATKEGVLVDQCDPLFKILLNFDAWGRVKQAIGRNLNRTLCGTYLLITAEEDYPDYTEIRDVIDKTCRRLNANSGVPEPNLDQCLD